MSRVNTPIISEAELLALQKAYESGDKHAFRKRCQLILLKVQGRDSKDVGNIVNMCEMSVNNWVKRYKLQGIEGLRTKQGRGRKPILSKDQDQCSILEAVQANRQRIDMAKAEWESQNANKTVSRDTFRRFLKVLAASTSE